MPAAVVDVGIPLPDHGGIFFPDAAKRIGLAKNSDGVAPVGIAIEMVRPRATIQAVIASAADHPILPSATKHDAIVGVGIVGAKNHVNGVSPDQGIENRGFQYFAPSIICHMVYYHMKSRAIPGLFFLSVHSKITSLLQLLLA